MSIDTRITPGSTRVRTLAAARTVADVDLRPRSPVSAAPGPSDTSPRFAVALRNITQNVRADDRICPYGVSRIAVVFGPGVDAVTPKTLGERLARAIVHGPAGDDRRSEHPEPSAVPEWATAGSSRGAATTRLHSGVGTISSTTVVTVDRLLGGGPTVAKVAARRPTTAGVTGPSGVRALPSLLRHRTVVRYSTGRLITFGKRHDDRPPPDKGGHGPGAVLVVDSDLSADGTPGLSALAMSSLSERLGFTSGVISLVAGDALITEIDHVGLDLVVMMIGAEPDGKPSSWSSSTWCVPAGLAGDYRTLGIDVLAVSTGAGAGAMAGCIQQGASALFDLNALPAVLHDRSRSGSGDRQWPTDRKGSCGPPQMLALLKLTSSERRVLYYLTTGESAHDIAEDLVVSLATVRSHIRSILRKLGVRSQLAAVAMANSRGHALDEAVGDS